MKKTCLAAVLIAATVLVSFNANAWFKSGLVLCDANGNGQLDPATDVPVPSVLVVLTNSSGTFSNAAWSMANGQYVMELPPGADTYFDFVHPLTLPAGTLAVMPWVNSFVTTSTVEFYTNHFLIRNPACEGMTNATNACWLTGGGVIRQGRGQPEFSFGGNVWPGCNADAGDGGNWNVIAHKLKLHFQATAIETVSCGNVADQPPGSTSPETPYNYIEFQGVGVLKGKGYKNTMVYFSARAEDRGEPGAGIDRLYLRVYDAQQNTVLLISTQPSDASLVTPRTISGGNLQIHPCE